MQIAKKVLAVFLAVLFVLPGLGVGMTASAIETNGDLGNGLIYDLNYGYGQDPARATTNKSAYGRRIRIRGRRTIHARRRRHG